MADVEMGIGGWQVLLLLTWILTPHWTSLEHSTASPAPFATHGFRAPVRVERVQKVWVGQRGMGWLLCPLQIAAVQG